MADPTPTEIAGGTSNLATTTVSFASQAAGTVLLLWVASDDYRAASGAGRPESSGWVLQESRQGNLGHYLWLKVAAGGETSVQYTIGSATLSAYAVTAVDNIDTSNPVDASLSALSSTGSFTTGTTPAVTTSAGRRATFGGLGVASPNGAASMSAWTNGYIEVHDRFTTVGYRDGVGVAHLIHDGGGATSTGATFSAACDQVSGITLALRVASGGGGGITIQARPAVASAVARPPAVSAGGAGAAIAARPAVMVAAAAPPEAVAATILAGGGPAISLAIARPPAVSAGVAIAVQPAVAAGRVVPPAVEVGSTAGVALAVIPAVSVALMRTATIVTGANLAAPPALAQGQGRPAEITTGATITTPKALASSDARRPAILAGSSILTRPAITTARMLTPAVAIPTPTAALSVLVGGSEQPAALSVLVGGSEQPL